MPERDWTSPESITELERLIAGSTTPEWQRALVAEVRRLREREAVLVGLLREARPVVAEWAEVPGYGMYRPDNPHDFDPDPECSTEEERDAHKAACDAYDRGEPVPEDTSKPVASIVHNGVVLHECRQPWGLGSYVVRDPDLITLRDRIDAALTPGGS